MGKKTMLVILDGWGINHNEKESAIEKADTPYFDHLMQKYPNSTLVTHGERVGLPEGQMGNSEVGHMNLGAGRIVYQDLLKINLAIRNKELNQNPVILDAIQYAKTNNKKIHLLGLTSDGGVHSHIEHTRALASVCSENDFNNLYVHAFTDGRDTDPKKGLQYIRDLQEHLNHTTGQLASVTGRYYAMDRDTRWERTALAYNALVKGEGEKTQDVLAVMQSRYSQNETDEFLKPIIHTDAKGQPLSTIDENDVVIFTNFRSDRGRQLTEALTQKNHPEQGMQTMNLYYITFKTYDKTFKGIKTVFDSENNQNIMGEVLSKQDKKQLRIAETEKYPHVTYFFNNGREEPFAGEERILVASPRDVATYDEKPEMSAYEVKDKLVDFVDQNEPDFVCLNFANTDMVGHTGDFNAAMKAAEAVDACLKEVTEKGLEKDYSLMIIADHGNADYMVNDNGSPNTNHSMMPVPCILASNNGPKRIKEGKLGDVAPTLLTIMGIDVPEEMSGEVLCEVAEKIGK